MEFTYSAMGKVRQGTPSTDDSAVWNNFTVEVDILINALQNFEDKPEIKYFLNQFDDLVKAANFPDDIKLVLIKSKITGKSK